MNQEDENTANPLLRKHLDDIQEMLKGNQGVKLWWVLTALRGPDDPSDCDCKRDTTARIRSAAFPELISRSEGTVKIGNSFEYLYVDAESGPVYVGSVDTATHFRGHVWAASSALKINKIPRLP